MTELDLLPSEVRNRIRAQHVEILEMAESIEAMLTEPHEDSAGRIRKAVVVLSDILQLHMAFEEQHLLPALREADGFGPERVKAMLADHKKQRQELEILVRLVTEGQSESMDWKIKALNQWLRDDIQHEESTALKPDLLRDDVIRVEYGS